MRIPARQLLIPALLVLLVGQFGFSRLSEPYPALLMPGFGNVPGADGTVDVRQYRITATRPDGASYVDDGSQLLAGIFPQYRPEALDFLLSDGSTDGLGPFDVMRADNRRANERYLPEFRDWLRERLTALTGREDWQTVTFERFDSVYDLELDRIVRAPSPSASLEVEL